MILADTIATTTALSFVAVGGKRGEGRGGEGRGGERGCDITNPWIAYKGNINEEQ